MTLDYRDMDARFKLIAYVLFSGDVVRKGNVGTQTFAGIWENMPDKSKFAVMEATDGMFIVGDLTEVIYNTKLAVHLHRWKVQPTEEAAMAVAQMWGDATMSLMHRGPATWMKKLSALCAFGRTRRLR